MKLILLLTQRILKAGRESRFLSTITIISIIGVALGVAVLQIALAVLNGFEKEIENRIVGFRLHLDITPVHGNSLPYNENELTQIKSIFNKEDIGISPYAGQITLIKSKKFEEGVYIKGILPEYDFSDLKNSIVKGFYKLNYPEDTPSIIIGHKLARKLGISVGDYITAFSLQSFVILPRIEDVKFSKFTVIGIYESGMSEYDDLIAYTHLAHAQKLFDLNQSVSGYEIKFKEPSRANFYSNLISMKFGYKYYAKSIFQMYRHIFNWIELQKKPIPIVLALITVVAIFNIITTLLILVIDKTNSIGVLRTLGLTQKQVKIIFILCGFFIGVTGTILGNLLSIILLELQINFNVVKIPEGIYFLDKVPIALKIDSYLLVSSISILLSILFSFIPARFAGRMNIIKAIKFS